MTGWLLRRRAQGFWVPPWWSVCWWPPLRRALRREKEARLVRDYVTTMTSAGLLLADNAVTKAPFLPEQGMSYKNEDKETFCVYAVKYSNYEPEEIESLWFTEAQARTRCDRLNEESRVGRGMWRISCWEVQGKRPLFV